MIIHIPQILVDGNNSIDDLTINLIGNKQAKIKFDGIYNGEKIPIYYVVTDVGEFQLDIKSKSIRSTIRMINMSNKKSLLADLSVTLKGVIVTLHSGSQSAKIEINKGSNMAAVLQQAIAAIR